MVPVFASSSENLRTISFKKKLVPIAHLPAENRLRSGIGGRTKTNDACSHTQTSKLEVIVTFLFHQPTPRGLT